MERSKIFETDISRRKLISHAFAFVLGFSTIFVIGWGGAATFLGGLFGSYKAILAKIGGIVVIIFGLATIGLVRIPWFYYDTRPDINAKINNKGLLSSGLMGVFFAAGWTPCIGATLGAILTLSFVQGSSYQAIFLSGFYAFGLAVPFLGMAWGMESVVGWVNIIKPHLRKIQVLSGLLMILIGLMLVTNQISLIAIWAQQNNYYFDIPLGTTVPTASIAFLAGLTSFLSPCVLPLVPAYLGYLGSHVLGTIELKTT